MTLQTSVFSLDHHAMELIERKFRKKQLIAETRADELFDVFRQELTEEETWALKFLFAYMPVNDLADYDGNLFLSHVRRTLDIRRQVPWGEWVPDHLFLHFVLPYRVNTENIEDSRGILYSELADRTLPAKCIRRAGRIVTIITLGWNHGPTESGITSALANRNRF